MKMPRQIRLAAFTTIFLLSAPASAVTAEVASPKPWLKKMVDKAHNLAKRKVEAGSPGEKKWRAEAKAIINDMLDWDEMTRKSLGRNWKKRTPEEQKEFATLLREMVEASYQSKLKLAAAGSVKKPKKVVIDWLEEKVKGKRATVAASVKADKQKAVIGFKLVWNGKRWRVYDVAVDDVSTVRTYRSQFRKLIADKGWPALMERMRSKIEEIRAGRAEIGP